MRAAASLKLRRDCTSCHASHRFRGMRAAASLKRRRRQRSPPRLTQFPRHACRGLIEAQPSHAYHAGNAERFRGMRAAASLKLENRATEYSKAATVSAACVPRPH